MNILRLSAAIFSIISSALGFASAGYLAHYVNSNGLFAYYNSPMYLQGHYNSNRWLFLFNDTPDMVAGTVLGATFFIHSIIEMILAFTYIPSLVLRILGIASTICCLGSVIAIGAIAANSYYLHISPYLPAISIFVGVITIILSFDWDKDRSFAEEEDGWE